MKRFLLLFVVLAIVLLVSPFLNDSDNTKVVTGLPWQVEVLPDGSTRVFGLQLGVSRLSDALKVLGEDMSLAIIAATDEVGSLEMYYGHYRVGVISGKLILQTNASEKKIKGWRENAAKEEHMASGQAKKYTLSTENLNDALNEPVIGITFIPAVNLDEEIILARFGEPGMRVELAEVTHFLYPEKGVDVALFSDTKEVIQYVLPNNFKTIESMGR